MKLRQLSVSHVLHYASLDLLLNDEGSGFHILYGPNETGKTTLLNLIIDWLYGGRVSEAGGDYYESRSVLSGVIEDGAGKSLQFGRKKRYSKLEFTDRSVSEEDLAQFLGGYDRDRFALIFGLDHDRLRSGGESLLQSGGHAGVSLFEAGGGIQHLHNLLSGLDSRSRDLLDPSFRTHSAKLLNKHWAEFLNAEKKIREGSLGAQDWDQKRQDIFVLEAEIKQVRKERYELERGLEKIQRLKRVQTMLPELYAVRQQLRELGAVIVLEDDEESRIEAMITEHNDLELQIARVQKHVQQLRAKREELVPQPDVLAREAAIQKINQGLTQYETRRYVELPKLRQNQSECEDDMAFRIKDLMGEGPVVSVDMLRIPFSDMENVKQLIKQREEALARLNIQEQRHHELLGQRNDAQWELRHIGAVENVSELRKLLDQIRLAGNLEDMIAQKEADITLQQRSLQQILTRQSVYSGDLNTMEHLIVPLDATIDYFHQEWNSIRERHREQKQKRQQLEDEIAACERELEALELQGYVPIESELTETRRLRDQGWDLLKRHWLDREDLGNEIMTYAQGTPLEEVFEHYMRRADDMADSLRAQADKSAKRALLLLNKSQNENQRQQVLERLQEIQQEVTMFKKEWTDQWADSGIDVKRPADMKEWLATVYRPVVLGLNTLRSIEQDLKRLISRRDGFLRDLREKARKYQLTLPENSLKAQTEVCEDYVKEMEDRQRDAERLRRDLVELDRRLEKDQEMLDRCGQEVADLEEAWNEWRQRYPFVPQDYRIASPYLHKLEELFQWEQNKQEIAREIREKEAECRVFEENSHQMALALHEVMPDFSQMAMWVSRIRQRLELAKDIDTKRQQLADQLEEQEEELSEFRQKAEDVNYTLRQYLARCHCSEIDELRQCIKVSRMFKEARQAQGQLEQNIRQAGDGLPLTELEKEFAQVEHPEELTLKAEELRADVEKMMVQEEEYKQKLQEMKIQFQSLSGDQTLAAEAAQGAQYHLAEIDRLWTEYLRVELARRLLQRAIETYRQQNESSIIEQASDFFRRLTLNHYEQLTVEYENNIPYLEARHRTEGKRRVGQMSDGTRDQLYLALRLAFINQHLANGEPLPLIMDDILVHFDDERTQATLEVLNELASRTQILYFTHHQLVVDLGLQLRPRPAAVHYLAQLV
ncbi:MAG: AAA family ATPase [Firmicutes bacterium]|nr:AAA family ATPase [Bacillota bacterium]